MQKILVVLNDFHHIDAVLSKAIFLREKSGSGLEILYVHEEELFDVPDYFSDANSYEKNHLDKKKIQKSIKEKLDSLNFKEECAVLVFIDDTVDRVWTQTKEVEEVLIVTAYHDSITKSLTKKMHHPLLVIKNEINKYNKIIIPVDLTEASSPCIHFAKGLFDDDQLHLLYDYRFLLDVSLLNVDFLGMPTAQPVLDMQVEEEIKKSQMELFENLKKESNLKGEFIEQTLSVQDDLTQYIEKKGFDLTILCSHQEEFLFSDSISYDLLESLKTDVLLGAFRR